MQLMSPDPVLDHKWMTLLGKHCMLNSQGEVGGSIQKELVLGGPRRRSVCAGNKGAACWFGDMVVGGGCVGSVQWQCVGQI